MLKVVHTATAYESVITMLDSRLRLLNRFDDLDCTIISSPPEIADSRLPAMRHIQIEMSRAIKPVTDLRSIWQLYKGLSVSDGFILPSSHEGMPRAMMEAMAMGLPVLVTNAGGICDVVGNSEYGIVVPKQNAQALAEGLLKLVMDDNLRKELSCRSRARIVETFSLATMIERHIQLYHSLIY